MSRYDELIEIVNHDYSYSDELCFVKTNEEEEDMFYPYKLMNEQYHECSFDEDDRSDNDSVTSERMITFKVPEYYLYNEEFYQTPPETSGVNPSVLFQDQDDNYVKESAQRVNQHSNDEEECETTNDTTLVGEDATDKCFKLKGAVLVAENNIVEKENIKEEKKFMNELLRVDDDMSDNYENDADYSYEEEEDDDDYTKDPEYTLETRKRPKCRASRGSTRNVSSVAVKSRRKTSKRKRRKGSLSATETKFTCSQCKKAFDRKSNHDSHIRVHLTIRPHKCSLCGRGFARNSDRKRHEKGHLNKCVMKCHGKQSGIRWGCGTKFQSRMELKKHWLKKENQCLNGFLKGFEHNSKNGIAKCNDNDKDDFNGINDICILALLQLEKQQRVKRKT